MRFFNAAFRSSLLVMAVLVLIAGCGQKPKNQGPPPLPEVTWSYPVRDDVTQYMEYTGTTAAIESVDVRARVSGYLNSIHFEPRARVNAGDLLFVIDPRPYRARVEQAQAALDTQKAALRIREIELEKYSNLGTKEVVAQLKIDDVKAARDMAKAELERAKANLEAAKLELDYTSVVSPISGRVSRNMLDVGNLVGANENTLLASIVNDHFVYVYFNMSEADLLRLIRTFRRDNPNVVLTHAPQEEVPVTMGLADENGYPHTGKLDYTDVKLDSSTGTIQMRAIFPNEDGILFPGMFARLRIPAQTRKALLVPDMAVFTDQAGKYVLVCNDKDTVEVRRIKTAESVQEFRVIDSGLNQKDRVIINGLQRARPGTMVKGSQSQLHISNAAAAYPELQKN